MDRSGHLFGTTEGGGAHGTLDTGGTVFELTPSAAKTKWTETVLYSFCARGGDECTDGGFTQPPVPASVAVLIMDELGHLYGTTVGGGAHNPPYGRPDHGRGGAPLRHDKRGRSAA